MRNFVFMLADLGPRAGKVTRRAGSRTTRRTWCLEIAVFGWDEEVGATDAAGPSEDWGDIRRQLSDLAIARARRDGSGLHRGAAFHGRPPRSQAHASATLRW